MATERSCWHPHCIRSDRLPTFARGTHKSRPSRSAADAFDPGRHAKSRPPSWGLRPRRTMPSMSHRAAGQAAEAKALSRSLTCPIAFSSEVDTGSREENASKQESRGSVLIQSEPIALDDTSAARPKTKKIAQPRPATLRARQPRSPPQAGAPYNGESKRAGRVAARDHEVHIARNARSRSLVPI